MATFKTLHAHAPGTDITLHGESFIFDADGYGHLTTTHPGVIARLREISEGFIEVGAAPAPEPAPEDAGMTSFVLVRADGQTLDLATLNDDLLRLFAAENGLKVHHRAKGNTLRAAIVRAVAEAVAPVVAPEPPIVAPPAAEPVVEPVVLFAKPIAPGDEPAVLVAAEPAV